MWRYISVIELVVGCIKFQVYLKISRLVLTYLELNLKLLQSLRLP